VGEETLAEGISEDEVLVVMVGEGKCTKPSAATAERIVKFLLSQPAVNLFFAMIVLGKTAEGPIQEGFKIEAQEEPILKEETKQDHKTTNSLRQLTVN